MIGKENKLSVITKDDLQSQKDFMQYEFAAIPCGIAEQPEFTKNYIENNKDIIIRYESYYQETVLPKMEEDGCSENTISEYLAYRELMCDPLTFLLDVFFKEDKTFFDDYSILNKEFKWEWNDDGQMRYIHDELLSMSNNKDDGWWEDEGRPDKIETYNRGKKIYTDLYGDPVGQKIYEVGGAELANAFGNAYTNNFPNILLNMESIPASEYKNEYEIFYRQPDLAVMDLLFNIGLNYHRRKYQINNG